MDQYLSAAIDYLLPQRDELLYLFLFLSSIVENLFPPIPGDTITVFSAFLVGTGRLDYFMVFLSSTSGSVIGFYLLFLVGRHYGRDFFISKNYRIFSRRHIFSAEKWFHKRGYLILLVNRFMPGVRSVISLTAGILHMPSWKVLLLSGVSASVWNLIWIHVGYTIGGSWDTVRERAGEIMTQYNAAASIAVVLFFAVSIYLLYRNRQKIKERALTRKKIRRDKKLN